MKAPLYKVQTNDSYPARWQWDGTHHATEDDASQHAATLHPDHWQVQILGRAPNGKWVSIGSTIYNGNASVRM